MAKSDVHKVRNGLGYVGQEHYLLFFSSFQYLHYFRAKLWSPFLTICPLGNFECFFVVCKKSTFSINSFRNTIRVSNSLDPYQARHFVGPGFVPNCLQRLSADNTSRQRINGFLQFKRKFICMFLINVSPPILLDAATSNFVAA